MRDVVDKVTSDWAKTQRARLTISGNAVVLADAIWLGHAVRNLLRTAAASGGEEIEVSIESIDNRVKVVVTDDGAAIPSEENDRIAEPYYSFSEVNGLAPSLGLGLAVARRIARASGGDLHYQRLEGRNEFELKLPGHKSQVLPRDTFSRVVDPSAGMPAAGAIEEVIANGDPPVAYQPIFALSRETAGPGEIVGYEALARFPSHTPRDWFVAASRQGLRVDLELACLRAAIEGFHPVEEDTFLGVNVSDETIHATQLTEAAAAIAPVPLVLELPETASIASYQATRDVLEELSVSGISLAIDHVASDRLDLDQMAQLEPRMIKFGVSLLREAIHSPRDRGLIKAMTAMADELGVMVVVVGVETADDHDKLTELGIRFGQGNLYARPRRLNRDRLAQETA
jgi:EAL domain-containing protein (putative c-di-GMP-specific phosphodiesterase class I)/anti-sigma regulatory factor (Ser/Thr protein kinase)